MIYLKLDNHPQVHVNEQLTLFQAPELPKEPKEINSYNGKPRLNSPIRSQVEFINSSLDDLIPDDHQVRNIWNYINQMDFTPFLRKIKSTSSNPGRSAIDPKILLGLWIYAIIEGIGSARVLDRYCSEHIVFKWICGGVSVNYHTISDFRKNNPDEFDELISDIIARLMKKELISLKRVSQDGMRVRASAGSSSFRKKETLKNLHTIAKEQVSILRKELDEDSSTCLSRQKAAKKRAAEDRLKRVEEAIEEQKQAVIQMGCAKKKQRKTFTKKEKEKIRASTTDPEAKKMKMGNGGFNPAYNFQIAIDTQSRFIVGSFVTKKNSDFDQLIPMQNKIKEKYNIYPKEMLVDQGYLEHNNIKKAQEKGTKIYVNPRKLGNKNPNEPRPDEHGEIAEWRVRMGSEEAKEIYKDRAATSEWANAGMRNRGLKQLLVRGEECVNNVLSLHVLTHNILRSISLNVSW